MPLSLLGGTGSGQPEEGLHPGVTQQGQHTWISSPGLGQAAGDIRFPFPARRNELTHGHSTLLPFPRLSVCLCTVPGKPQQSCARLRVRAAGPGPHPSDRAHLPREPPSCCPFRGTAFLMHVLVANQMLFHIPPLFLPRQASVSADGNTLPLPPSAQGPSSAVSGK